MSSANGVEAFLAAKWKSKKLELEDDSDEDGLSGDEPESQYESKVCSNPQTPKKSPERQQNTSKKEFCYYGDVQAFKRSPNRIRPDGEIRFTGTVLPDGTVSFFEPENVYHLDETNRNSSETDEYKNVNNDEDALNAKLEMQEHKLDEIPFMEEDVRFVELETVKRDRVNQYEMTGDVWELIEEQNDDKEEEPAVCSAKKAKVAGDVDAVFGALDPKDVARIAGKVDSDTGKVIETASGVPKMVIPFSNFGKLLEQSENEPIGPLIPKRLYERGLSTEQNAKQMDKVNENKPGPRRFKTKPGPASRRRRTSGKNTQPEFKPEGVEPDSTTKPRQTTPSSQGREQYDGHETLAGILEKNLNQRLLSSTPQQNQWHPEARNELDLIREHATKPSKLLEINNGIVPISRAFIDPQAKNVAYNVYRYFENRKKQYNMNFNELRVSSEATGMPKTTISKIVAEAVENMQDDLRPFVESRRRRRPKNTSSEPNVKRDCIARMFIHNSYLIQKEVPTVEKIIQNCLKNGFEDVLGTTADGVKAHLKKLGFEYNFRSGNQEFLVERPDFIAQRIKYLETMLEYREQRKNIVYVFIADLLKKGVRRVEWEGWDGVFQETEHGVDIGCASVLHAANDNFVYHDCLQVIEYEVNSRIGLPRKRFVEWLTTKLLPRVPAGSVIVLGDKRFHRMVDRETRPHVGCTKEQIAGWLRQNFVQCDASWPKAVLLEKVQKVVLEQKYAIDDEITAMGYIPVHIPSHHRDLNPLSFLWQDIKDKLDTTPEVVNIRTLRTFVKDEFTKAAVKLGKAWTQVEKLEKSYYNIDMHTDDEKEELIRKYGNSLVPIDNTDEMDKSDEENNLEDAY